MKKLIKTIILISFPIICNCQMTGDKTIDQVLELSDKYFLMMTFEEVKENKDTVKIRQLKIIHDNIYNAWKQLIREHHQRKEAQKK